MTEKLCITEFAYPSSPGITPKTAPLPALATQRIDIGVASVQSAAFSVNTRLIRLYCEVPCAISVGDDPEADPMTATQLISGIAEYFSVTPGHKLAVVSTGTDGEGA